MTKVPTETERAGQLNYGVTTLGEAGTALACAEKTYVVLGVSRGGTSAIAGVLNHLGVPMGPTGEAPLFEDLPMNRALRGDASALDAVIADRNMKNPTWGFKGNAITQPFEEVACKLRNPIFVVIFRDLLAIANRAKISADRDVASILLRQSAEYQRILDFVVAGKYYSVMISYEKLCMYPREVIELLLEKAGLTGQESQVMGAVEFIRPAPEDYLVVSRANNAKSGK